MSLYRKIILIIFGLAYFISPLDIIPDLILPYIGWLDDGIIIAAIIYLIRYGRLPYFIFKKAYKKKQEFKNKNFDHNSFKENNKKANLNNINPYKVLGVSSHASKRQVKQAYKEAIKKYHPDKVSHLGEEFSDLANDKFLEIQTAYEILMKKL